jgi:hypothetical protein
MFDSYARINKLLAGGMPDRAPLFDLIRNDRIIEYFGGGKMTPENTEAFIYKTVREALDATRSAVDEPRPITIPLDKETEYIKDGRRRIIRRWTTWAEHRKYSDAEDYIKSKRDYIREHEKWSMEDEKKLGDFLKAQQCAEEAIKGTFLFWETPANLWLEGIFEEVGLEQFSYYLTDCYDVIIEQLEFNLQKGLQRLDHLPAKVNIPAAFYADDIAYKSGPLFSPDFLNKEYFPRMKKIIDQLHARGNKVMFHSDGNLNLVLETLVGTGIDILNPIEVLADMKIIEIHRRFPKLLMAGGIDVSQLLPFGKPEEVRDAVTKAIEEAEGKIMIGSTTELHAEVSLDNFLAMRDTVLKYSY